MHSIVKYCFPFFLILRILRDTHRADLFVEVTNLMKGNTIWTHYTLTGYHPTSIRLLRQIPKEKVCINTSGNWYIRYKDRHANESQGIDIHR